MFIVEKSLPNSRSLEFVSVSHLHPQYWNLELGPHTHQPSALPLHYWAKPLTPFVFPIPPRISIELIFMCDLREGFNFSLLLVDLWLSQHYLVKRSFFLHWMALIIKSEGKIYFQIPLISIYILTTVLKHFSFFIFFIMTWNQGV